ncbi:MAG: LysM peptidoglycan-binding domain-containing protein [Aggregatilineales bacterium]
MKFTRRSIGVLLILVFSAFLVNAQEDDNNIPPQLDIVLASLSQGLREDVSRADLISYEWIRRDFSDTSLGCPSMGANYAQVITPGYQFFLTYDGTLYDYRVSDSGDSVVLCDSRPAVTMPDEPMTPLPMTCEDTYTVAEGENLFGIAQQCNTTVAALIATNPDIEDRSLIFAGQTISIPENDGETVVSIRPDSGSAGMTIRLYAAGFPPGANVSLGIGPPESEYIVVGTREIGDDGELDTTLRLSDNLAVGTERVAVVVLNNEETVSEVFTVTDEVFQPTAVPTQPADGAFFEQSQIYLVALGDAGRSGNPIGCDDSIIPVTVTFESTQAPLTAALTELLDINSRTYGQSGLYNALYQSDLTLTNVTIQNGEAVINMTGSLTIGGVCDQPRVEAQLRQTALQYSTVDTVTINVNGETLDTAF